MAFARGHRAGGQSGPEGGGGRKAGMGDDVEPIGRVIGDALPSRGDLAVDLACAPFGAAFGDLGGGKKELRFGAGQVLRRSKLVPMRRADGGGMFECRPQMMVEARFDSGIARHVDIDRRFWWQGFERVIGQNEIAGPKAFHKGGVALRSQANDLERARGNFFKKFAQPQSGF